VSTPQENGALDLCYGIAAVVFLSLATTGSLTVVIKLFFAEQGESSQ